MFITLNYFACCSLLLVVIDDASTLYFPPSHGEACRRNQAYRHSAISILSITSEVSYRSQPTHRLSQDWKATNLRTFKTVQARGLACRSARLRQQQFDRGRAAAWAQPFYFLNTTVKISQPNLFRDLSAFRQSEFSF